MESSFFQAGRILVLVGAIINTVTAAFLLVGAAFFLWLSEEMGGGAVVGAGVYVAIGVVAAVGAVFGFLAHGRAREGNVHGAWVFGITSSLLPPVQVVTLVGAILIMTSPENQAARAPVGS